ncbi:hypothetical protein J6590_095789 [Homalodisca vitripennis]|nr:hypothetical protein J6590_095789 [Homalodisca vitripennis]
MFGGLQLCKVRGQHCEQVTSRERDSQLRRPLALSLNNRSLLPSGILLDRFW